MCCFNLLHRACGVDKALALHMGVGKLIISFQQFKCDYIGVAHLAACKGKCGNREVHVCVPACLAARLGAAALASCKS